nr:MAG TPA: hypothetical protein [Caudoviricetes sp.]
MASPRSGGVPTPRSRMICRGKQKAVSDSDTAFLWAV